MIKRRVERHESVAGFLAQARHLLQAAEAVERAQRSGSYHHMGDFAPQQLLQLIADANAGAVKQQMRLAVAQLARDPLRHRRARRFRHCRQPPQLADRFEPAELAVKLQQIAVQTHQIDAAGLLAEGVDQPFRQPAQRVAQLEEARAEGQQLFRQFAEHKAKLARLVVGGQQRIERLAQRGEQLAQFLAVRLETLRIAERRRRFRPHLRHNALDQPHEEIELQAAPAGRDVGAHLQRVARYLRQMVAFIQHQHQVFRRRQHRLVLHRRHHQRMVSHHHICLLDFTAGDEEGAFAIPAAVRAEAARFVCRETLPQAVADILFAVIAQSVPGVAAKRLLQPPALRLLFLSAAYRLVVEIEQQIALLVIAGRQRRQVARANVAPAPEGGGEGKIGNDLFQ